MRDWDFDGQLARTLKIAGFLLVFFCLSLVLRPEDPVTWGFLAGTAVGMWNAFFLSKRLKAIADMAVPRARAHMKAGFALRLTIILAVLFFVARTGWINLYAAAAGLFVVPCLFTFGAVGVLLREAREARSLRYRSKN
ncbi:MAG: ATP synthase subunit I [Peptococcaceae bacterium]|nr:ATP synthase subunit I [Peptococcaceae bacterium]